MTAQLRKPQAFGRSAPFQERLAKQAPQVVTATIADVAQREGDRLTALDQLDILDTPREEAFDRITRLTKRLFDAPIAIVSFIDGHRQWYKSCEGLETCEVAREDTFCRHILENGKPLVVEDATIDPRFGQNPAVTGAPYVRSYAGVPLRTPEGHNVGTLCVLDTRPREFEEGEIDLLNDLGKMTMDEVNLRLLASEDSLTGAMSRRAFKEEGRRMSALALRHHDELSLIALDIDHFKSVNDRSGHAGGDMVLTTVIKACVAELRGTDIVGRLGGEEFAVLLPNTGLADAMLVGEKLRAAIEALVVGTEAGDLKVTASFGVASLDSATRDFETLLRNADTALYKAKETGRNRAIAFESAGAAPRAAGRRVLKGGRILFNGGTSSIDCTVRGISDEGASLSVSNSAGIPKRFDLSIPADDFLKSCRVVLQTEKQVEVAFT